MKKNNNKFKVFSFYRFTELHKKNQIKDLLSRFCEDMEIRGTILLADEGINGVITGKKKVLEDILKYIRELLHIRNIELKINSSDTMPFNKFKIRLKKEIVSLGKVNIDVNKFRGKYLKPGDWDKVISEKDTKVIDVRNIYEINIGKFRHAINPNTNNFREFPGIVKKLNLKKDDKIAMYCTGGIRCEKASAYLKFNGFHNVNQLKGGVIKYLEYHYKEKKSSLWKGECFVFDKRVSINRKLKKGSYDQCYGCRQPITQKEKASKHYKKGVYCPYCFNMRSKGQLKRLQTRQNQIDRALNKKIKNPFLN
tara:strand:+ start:693 stop:1619 length:927 start_codon:yes stop_codon:yes gene_type:complete